jgi:hypothetical protein
VSEIVAANKWLEEVYDPVIAAIPADLRGRLAPAEIFHEILEHRWYMSETAGRDVGTTAAARSYFKRVLPNAPEPLEGAANGALPHGNAEPASPAPEDAEPTSPAPEDPEAGAQAPQAAESGPQLPADGISWE